MSEYAPVPVEAAKSIATEYGKSIVIVLAWDQEHGALHTTTYGVSEKDKVHAAHGGEIASEALGCDLSKAQVFEDFRDKRIQALEDAIANASIILADDRTSLPFMAMKTALRELGKVMSDPEVMKRQGI